MTMNVQKELIMLAALLAMIFTMSIAHAEEEEDEGQGAKYSEHRYGKERGEDGEKEGGKALMPAKLNAKFKQECTGCHIAYPPGLLPAESWRKMMAGLDKHFGSNASLDPQDNKEITDFLVANASTRWSGKDAPLRITDTAWFKREHDSEDIPSRVWKNPKVKSASNCGACHTKAEQGDFSEHNVRLPK